MDNVEFVLILIVLFEVIARSADYVITRYYPDSCLSKKQRNQRVINKATETVRNTGKAVRLEVYSDGNVSRIED